MTTATRINEVINALYDAWNNDPGLAAAECTVVDGPWSVEAIQRRLHVASSGVDEDDDPAVTVAQHSPHANDVARDEEIRVTCAVWLSEGAAEGMRQARQAASDLLDLALVMPRTTQNLGLSNVFYVGVDEIALRHVQSADGAGVVFTFVVVVRARIYS